MEDCRDTEHNVILVGAGAIRRAATEGQERMSGWTDDLATEPVVPDAAESESLVEVERVDWVDVEVAVVKFNRPKALNPLDKDTVSLLRSVLERLTEGPIGSGPPAIVLTGNGSSFSAGGDLRGYQTLYRDAPRFHQFVTDFAAACKILESCDAVTAAMVNGTCVAGGLEIALACDLITIADSARIGDGHLKFGQLPGAGGSQRLVRAIGSARATKWLLSAELYEAREAEAAGLAALKVPLTELRSATLDLVASIARCTPLGRQRMKELITIAETSDLDEGLQRERDLVFDYATSSHDATEGLNVFIEKRPPNYLGR